MDNSKPVDHPDRETVEVRQGTGPRATVSVLLISLFMMVAVGVVFLGYGFWVR
jgi:nitrate reductase NapE component